MTVQAQEYREPVSIVYNQDCMEGMKQYPDKYKWLISEYGTGMRSIIDTHLGSGSSRIAAFDMGFDFTAFEIDKDYFEAQEKRFQQHKAQLKLFV